VTNNYAILDIASKRHEDFLYNMYKMAKNAVDKGDRDNWTIHPKRIERHAPRSKRRSLGRRGGACAADAAADAARANRGVQQRPARSEDARPARLHPAVGSAGFPHRDEVRQHADQGRRGGASRDCGVHRGGKQYPAAPTSSRRRSRSAPTSWTCSSRRIIPTTSRTQADRRAALRRHGYNLAYSMGIKYDRILDGFDGPFEKLADVVAPAPGRVTAAASGGGTS